jgi:hypothetical protein
MRVTEAISQDKLQNRLRDKLRSQYGGPVPSNAVDLPDFWIAEFFDEYLIAEIGNEFWQIPYTATGDGLGQQEISPRDQWTMVEKDEKWVEKRAMELARIRGEQSRQSNFQILAQIEPRAAEADDESEPTGKEWQVTIIGATGPEDVVTVEGRQFIKSKNGRLYAVDALKNSTPEWHEIQVFDNHLTDEEFKERGGMRSVIKEMIGVLVDPVFRAGPLPKLTATFKVAEEAAREKLKNLHEMGVLKAIGLSIDTAPTFGQQVFVNNQPMDTVEGFSHIHSLDLVGNPAAGGGFDRLIAAEINDKEKATMTPEEIKELVGQAITEALPAALAEAFPAQEPGTQEAEGEEETPTPPEPDEAETETETPEPDTTTDETTEQVQALAQELEQLKQRERLSESRALLGERLTESSLPPDVQAIVRDMFKDRVFEEAELTRFIEQMQKARAAMDPTGQVNGAGSGIGHASSVITVEEKAEAEFLRLLMGNTSFRGLESNEEDFVKERVPESYKAWQRDERPANYGIFKFSEWLRTFYGDPFTGAPARISEAVTTSSMSSIVKNAVNVMIAADFSVRYRWWEPLVRTEEVDTIDQATLIRIFGLANLDTVGEGAPYTELAWEDEEETPTFQKRGNYVGITLESMLRDKVNAIRTLPQRLATSWFNTKSTLAANVFTVNTAAGPVLGDTGALFNATATTTAGGHANLLTAALSFASYGAARTAMRKQTDRRLGAGNRLGASPAFLLVPEDLETTALQIRDSDKVTGSANNDPNPYQHKFEVVVVPPWTDTDNWALVADPMPWPAIYDIVVAGNRVPSIFSAGDEAGGAMFTNDILRYKVRMLGFRFDATYDTLPVGDFRPLHKSNV